MNIKQENERAEKGQKTAKRISYLDLCVNLPEGGRLRWPMKTTLDILYVL